MDKLSRSLKVWLHNYQQHPIYFTNYQLIVRFHTALTDIPIYNDRYTWRRVSPNFWYLYITISPNSDIYETIISDLTVLHSIPELKHITGPGFDHYLNDLPV